MKAHSRVSTKRRNSGGQENIRNSPALATANTRSGMGSVNSRILRSACSSVGRWRATSSRRNSHSARVADGNQDKHDGRHLAAMAAVDVGDQDADGPLELQRQPRHGLDHCRDPAADIGLDREMWSATASSSVSAFGLLACWCWRATP